MAAWINIALRPARTERGIGLRFTISGMVLKLLGVRHVRPQSLTDRPQWPELGPTSVTGPIAQLGTASRPNYACSAR
ncbi:hypothetical protein GCM10027447_22180 [Glycomyces halotolerans]